MRTRFRVAQRFSRCDKSVLLTRASASEFSEIRNVQTRPHRRRKLPPRVDPLRLPARPHFSWGRRAAKRQRQYWRDQCFPQIPRARCADLAARRRQGMVFCNAGRFSHRRESIHFYARQRNVAGRIVFRRRALVSHLAQISRRQRRRNGPWFFSDHCAESHSRSRRYLPRCRARIPLRVPGIGHRGRALPLFRVVVSGIRQLMAGAGLHGTRVSADRGEALCQHHTSGHRNRESHRRQAPRLKRNAAMSKIAVIGAGAWGTGLAIVLGRKGTHQVRMWAHETDVCQSIAQKRINEKFLPGRQVPQSVSATNDLASALEGAEIVVSVMPSQHCRGLFQRMRTMIPPRALIVSATKGLEENSLQRMTEVIADVLKSDGGSTHPIGALSGPSFAQEVARGDPTAITIASQDAHLLRTVQQEFSDPAFRIYTNNDVVGVELGGALKNTVAIAAGVCDGLGLGHNSVAALITRGLAEMTRLVLACGGESETMAGLAGLGDLVLTCTGGLSRNRSVGIELGRGRRLPEIVAGMRGMVAEGIFTTAAAVELARIRGVEMPITEQMHAILHEGKSPREAIQELMSRAGKSETRER